MPFEGDYPITQRFGENPDIYGPGGHPGIDYGLPEGTDVLAARSGTVTWAGPNGHAWLGRGIYVCLSHGGGLESYYMHLSVAAVWVGQAVEAGQLIGRSGNSGWSTGPHLHWDVRQDGVPINPEAA